MALATRPDVEARLGRSLSDQQEHLLVETLLGDVESLLLSRLPTLLVRAATNPVLRSRVVAVESAAVARVLRNPEGYRTEQSGPFSYTIDTRAAAGFLTVLAEEWRSLGDGGMRTIAPYVDPYPGVSSRAYDLLYGYR